MKTIILFFSNHTPIEFTGTAFMCEVQIMNARLYPSFTDWDEVN
jgi:hypothetical protein